MNFNSHFHSNDPDKIDILVGTNTLSSGGTHYRVKFFIIHPNYDNKMYANDIGLVRVRDPIEFNDKVQPIPISPKEVPDKTLLTVTG